MKTEFVDQHNQPIYVGDIVLWRLGKFSKKSNGPSYYRVTNSKRGIILTDPALGVNGKSKFIFRRSHQQYVTIYDKLGRETSAS